MRPPESWSSARLTLALVAGIAIAHFVIGAAGWSLDAIYAGGFVPAHAAAAPDYPAAPFWLTPLTATFLHADIIHLAFNLLILAFCGRAVEAVVGRAGFAILYLVGAYAAAGAQFLMDPASNVPMIGASGAVSAVLGCYAILFGRHKVKVADPRLGLWLHALWLLAAWVALQAVLGLVLSGISIAIAAHIGGFVAGLLLATPLLLLRYRRA